MKRLYILFTLLAACFISLSQEVRPKLAVYSKGTESVDEIISNKLMRRMVESGRYRPVDRSEAFQAALSKELSIQKSGVVDEKRIAKIGKQYGAQQVCVLSKEDVWHGDKYISAHIIDVESAEIAMSFSAFGKLNTTKDLNGMVDGLTNNFIEVFDCFKLPSAKTVAVYVKKTDNRDVDIIIGDQLVAGFAKSGNYIAVERTDEFILKLKDEVEFQRSGMVDDKQFAKLGKQFGVQYVCAVKTMQFDGLFYISARLVDVETAEVVKMVDREEVRFDNGKDVIKCGKSIVLELAGKTAQEIISIDPDLNYDNQEDDGIVNEVDMNGFTEEVVNGEINSPILEEKEEEVEEEVVIIPDVSPQFPGGEAKLYEYLAENIKYPDLARDGGITGKVFVQFVVEKDGSITNVQVKRDVGGGCGDEAKRVIRSMPNWKPGKVGGRTVRSQFIIPINFNLIDSEPFVDLGLSSGTRWGKLNEEGFLSYDDAVSGGYRKSGVKFGSRLPTKEQWDELINECDWKWIGFGYRVVSKVNGEHIDLPMTGYQECNGTVDKTELLGCYWTVTQQAPGYAFGLVFSSDSIKMDVINRCMGYSVRLVKMY